VTCGLVRGYLSELAQGRTPPPHRAVWESLSPRNALTGSFEHPEITTVGEQVLRELEIRAYRVDPMPLDAVAAQVGAAIARLGETAEATEYFVAELGPVPPVAVLPLLRIVASDLAPRPEPADDLVEAFKNAWGSMEVLGGSSEDRLLAAELMVGSGVPQESFYSPMMATVDQLRSDGSRVPLATATLLHLYPSVTATPSLERWRTARRTVGQDEEAALLSHMPDLERSLDSWRAWFDRLEGETNDRRFAAAYLALGGAPTPERESRLRETVELVRRSFERPLLASALLVAQLPFRPAELVDWLTKATDIATVRQLAPNRAELSVIGLSLLRGLPPSDGTSSGPPMLRGILSGAGLPAQVALHAGLFRPLRASLPRPPPRTSS
jgi:hypothetical protein